MVPTTNGCGSTPHRFIGDCKPHITVTTPISAMHTPRAMVAPGPEGRITQIAVRFGDAHRHCGLSHGMAGRSHRLFERRHGRRRIGVSSMVRHRGCLRVGRQYRSRFIFRCRVVHRYYTVSSSVISSLFH